MFVCVVLASFLCSLAAQGVSKCSWRVDQPASTVNEAPIERFELYSCPQEGRPLQTACCPAPNEYSKCCLPEHYGSDTTGQRGNLPHYLWQNYSWLFYWAFAGIGFATASATCAFCSADRQWSCKKNASVFASVFCCTFGVLVPCFGIPAFLLWLLFFRKIRCNLCGEDIRITTNSSKYHKMVCKEYRMEEYQRIPDSTNYFCKKCDDAPLKVWPAEKLAKKDCSKCSERITNSGSNLHLCFICDKALCARHVHPTDPSAAVIVDWDFLEDIPGTDSDPSSSALLVQPSSSSALPPYTPPQSTAFQPSAPSVLPGYLPSEIGVQGSTTTSYIPRDSVHLPPSDPYPDLPPSYDIAIQDEEKS